MAGGILKGFGIPLIVLGILLLVAGLAAAAYGAFLMQENDDRLVADPDQEEQAQVALVAGGSAFLVGLLLLVLGLILNAAGNGRRHRELLAAAKGQVPVASAPAPQATPRPSRRRTWIAAGLAVAVLILILAGAAAYRDSEGSGGLGGESGRFDPLDFDGTVRQALSAPVAGAFTADNAESQQEFGVPVGASVASLTMDWTPTDTGAAELRILVEAFAGGAWTEVGRQGGAGPLDVDVALDGSSDMLRFRVFPEGEGAVVEQPFHVHVEFR